MIAVELYQCTCRWSQTAQFKGVLDLLEQNEWKIIVGCTYCLVRRIQKNRSRDSKSQPLGLQNSHGEMAAYIFK